MNYTIIETSIFTKRVIELFTDEEYKDFQSELLKNPTKGDVISGSKGLRKIRVASSGRGKRGGSRVIYYLQEGDKIIFLLLIFPKNEQENLSNEQLSKLIKVIESIKQ
jgi:mRNA-degrading endonuclease RelE of RelBE toxin-antitoxin system